MVFYFKNDSYQNITVTISNDSMIIYTKSFVHATKDNIVISLPEEMETGCYKVNIDNENVSILGTFDFD